jgi:hypothetical protein
MTRRKPAAPKMADIARLAGVHVSTVSRALAGSPLVESRMREAILEIAARQGYVVNPAARNLRTSRTQTLSVVIPLAHERGQPLTDPFFTDMLGHLADEITRRGYGMYLEKVVPPMDGWLARLIAARRADGIIVVGQSTEHEALDAAAATYSTGARNVTASSAPTTRARHVPPRSTCSRSAAAVSCSSATHRFPRSSCAATAISSRSSAHHAAASLRASSKRT